MLEIVFAVALEFSIATLRNTVFDEPALLYFDVVPPDVEASGPICAKVAVVVLCAVRTMNVPLKLVSVAPAIRTVKPGERLCAVDVVTVTIFEDRTSELVLTVTVEA